MGTLCYLHLRPVGIIRKYPVLFLGFFWYKPKNQNKKEELTFIQKKYAYGLKFLNKDKNEIKFQFVSYNKRSFTLKRNKGGKFRVFTFSQNRETEVQRIYIHLSGGSFWFPKISKIILPSFFQKQLDTLCHKHLRVQSIHH